MSQRRGGRCASRGAPGGDGDGFGEGAPGKRVAIEHDEAFGFGAGIAQGAADDDAHRAHRQIGAGLHPRA